MNRLKFLHRWFLLLALASLLTSCSTRRVDLAATPSPQESRTSVFTSASTSEPTLIPSGTFTETLSSTAFPIVTPTQTVIQITPIITGHSEGMENPSPDSLWLPYIDFKAQTLHFIDSSNFSICDFPSPINYTSPDRFIAWLPDGRVVVQAANGVYTGLPCFTFNVATQQEILILDHSDPSFSPDGRYQIVMQSYTGASKEVNEKIDLKDVASGKKLVETIFMRLAGGGSNLPGYWLDASHFLISETGDQGPLLLTPGKPAIKVATDIFHLPIKPGSGEYDLWDARAVAAQNSSQFHLMLIATSGDSNPLQIYHSESGQIETLPYLASQGAFSNDGHWLLVTKPDVSGQQNVLIRSIDPPGGTFQPFSVQELPPTWWSPDGSMYYQVSQDLTKIAVYTSPGRTFLGAWQAQDYELWPSWSPDGKYLAVWGRKHTDYNQESIFVIAMPTQK
jgi:hypothetical protein